MNLLLFAFCFFFVLSGLLGYLLYIALAMLRNKRRNTSSSPQSSSSPPFSDFSPGGSQFKWNLQKSTFWSPLVSTKWSGLLRVKDIYNASQDSLFTYITDYVRNCRKRQTGKTDIGKVLDAGTGRHSLSWAITLKADSMVAVTAEETMYRALGSEFHNLLRDGKDELALGTWLNPAFLQDQKFDFVICDYLVGAIEGFAPYFQSFLFERLAPHLEDDGYLCMVGVEPHTVSNKDTSSPEAVELCQLIVETCELRDACLKLSKRPVYREFPLFWCLHELPRAGYIVEDSKIFPSYTGKDYIKSQLGVAGKHLPMVTNKALKTELENEIERVRTKAKSMTLDRARFMDYYVIIARKDLSSPHLCTDPFKLLCPSSDHAQFRLQEQVETAPTTFQQDLDP